MARIKKSPNGDTPFQKLLGHNKDILVKWSALGETLVRDGVLSAKLKEQVRRTLAQENGCEYCKAKGKPDPKVMDERMLVAAGFAEVFLKHKGNIPDHAFGVITEYFTEIEISELCAFIAFTTASQYFGAMMRLEAE
ncbi:carboxymuconolactone decarboxylase family protein [Mangrovibacillus cuniculi]|uniref:Carboxymuconolactone decarboxylase family protein n=1 Tax=Mangrovibacillus cuniculi TaxID=2593652 RepID=A0A7S8CDZ9_9BACI|nr:carboxymuconolactone decarboxylase family protein [Mangrovibacillus cuniculi]QPC48249.1 carboxymuconolactone decarboxylase family protein [Mangrovibacillus cuniculi]